MDSHHSRGQVSAWMVEKHHPNLYQSKVIPWSCEAKVPLFLQIFYSHSWLLKNKKLVWYQDCGSLSILIGDLNESHLSFRFWSVLFIEDYSLVEAYITGVQNLCWYFLLIGFHGKHRSSVLGIHVFILGFWNVDHLFSHTKSQWNFVDPKLCLKDSPPRWCISASGSASPVQWAEASTDGNKKNAQPKEAFKSRPNLWRNVRHLVPLVSDFW